MERFGGLDDRDRACFKDMIRSTTARGAGGLLLPPSEPMMALSDALIQSGAPAHKASVMASQLGRTIKQRYSEEHGREPRAHKQSVQDNEGMEILRKLIDNAHKGWCTVWALIHRR